MAFMTKFCFSCSLRLGSVVIGVLTLIQASVLLGLSLMEADSPQTLTETLTRWMDAANLQGNVYKEIANNPKAVVVASSTFFVCLISSCVLLLFGCFQVPYKSCRVGPVYGFLQCKTVLMYPFLLFYLLYILALMGALLLAILFVKANGNGLGDLILYSNLGGFALRKRNCSCS
ncbi:uncharacterized protein [Tenebrio molitor]|uniref:uncharacterized protein isoform X1 n=1 Tax=Tenebrio molitor TaxID=7067 RepID=UPI0036246CD2